MDKSAGKRGGAPLRWILDSAVALAVLTGAMVILGYALRRSFYEALSYPSYYPLDPPHTYVVASAGFGTTVILTVVGGVLTTFLASQMTATTLVATALIANAGFLVLPVVLLSLVISRGDATWEVWTSAVVYTVVLVALGLRVRTVLEMEGTESSPRGLTVIALLVFLLCYTVAGATGEGTAERLVEGTYDRGSTIELTMRDSASPLSGSSFALVEIRDGNLFVVAMADPAPARPVLHIVPQSEILTARIQRMGGGAPVIVPAAEFSSTPGTMPGVES